MSYTLRRRVGTAPVAVALAFGALGAGPAGAGQPLAAVATVACAPNDGPAIALRIAHASREVLVVTLWGASLERLAGAPTPLELNLAPSLPGGDRGHAALCAVRDGHPATPCRGVRTLQLVLDRAGPRVGDRLAGRVHYRDAAGVEHTRAFSTPLVVPPEGGPICG